MGTLHCRDEIVDSILLNGTVGAGKSTLADAVSTAESRTHAVIDLDGIRRLSPAPRTDRFNHELELQNLASLGANFRRAGAERFILAGVIEEPAEVSRYVDALGSTGMFICRVVARHDVLETRLRQRHIADPEALQWHLTRVTELAQILESVALDDLVLDSSDRSATELGHIVRRAAGWN